MKRMNVELDDQSMSQMFSLMDSDNDGYINVEDFHSFLTKDYDSLALRTMKVAVFDQLPVENTNENDSDSDSFESEHESESDSHSNENYEHMNDQKSDINDLHFNEEKKDMELSSNMIINDIQSLNEVIDTLTKYSDILENNLGLDVKHVAKNMLDIQQLQDMNTRVLDICSNVNRFQSTLDDILHPNPMEYQTWNVNQMCLWITCLENGHFIQYIPLLKEQFVKNSISFGVHLPDIERKDLQSFGIESFPDRKLLEMHFQSLRNDLGPGKEGQLTKMI